MSQLRFFARKLTHRVATIDPATGESVVHECDTHDVLAEQGVLFTSMPEQHPLWERNGKDGKELVMMKDLGLYVICRVDEHGQVVNLYGRRGDFNKPTPISIPTVLELKRIFGGKTK